MLGNRTSQQHAVYIYGTECWEIERPSNMQCISMGRNAGKQNVPATCSVYLWDGMLGNRTSQQHAVYIYGTECWEVKQKMAVVGRMSKHTRHPSRTRRSSACQKYLDALSTARTDQASAGTIRLLLIFSSAIESLGSGKPTHAAPVSSSVVQVTVVSSTLSEPFKD